MANNPYVNKVQKADGTVLIDVSVDTATAADVAVGKYFHLATGERVEGTGGSSLPDGDNMGYGTTVLTDLTGTSWHFIGNPSILGDVLFYINFNSNNSNFDGFEFYNSVEIDYWQNGQPEIQAYVAGRWTGGGYDTISITGGTDVTNPDLIAWIQANATEVTA